jgi:hypothetical protein
MACPTSTNGRAVIKDATRVNNIAATVRTGCFCIPLRMYDVALLYFFLPSAGIEFTLAITLRGIDSISKNEISLIWITIVN